MRGLGRFAVTSVLAGWLGMPLAQAPLFADSSVLQVELAGPLSSTFKDKRDRNESSFVLRAEGDEHSIKVRVRGKSRAKLCQFPPLRLNFSDAEVADTLFAGQDKLKLVTHCRRGHSAQTNLLEEYAAYRIFKQLSEVGYRTRLLQIRYIDTDGKLKPLEAYAFVIESSTGLAERLGAERVTVEGVRLSSLDQQHAALVFIFNYLIGNTDWSLVLADGDDSCCHNTNLFDRAGQRYLVPYDFDMSGLVNAPYAKPNPAVRIANVTKRRYRGYCGPDDELAAALNQVAESQPAVVGVLEEIPGLSPKDVRNATRYVQRFFDSARDSERLLQRWKSRCL